MSRNKYLQSSDSLSSKRFRFQSAMDRDVQYEKTPFTYPTQISKGTLQANLGGVFQLLDKTGGTVLLTANPTTGVVTVNGELQANVNVVIGTLTSPTITGTTILEGTVTSTARQNNGTIANAVVGTPSITGGTATSQIINTPTIGTPTVTAGTFNTPVIGGTPTFDINAGSAALAATGNFAIQTYAGSPALVVRSGTVSYYFTCAGTL